MEDVQRLENEEDAWLLAFFQGASSTSQHVSKSSPSCSGILTGTPAVYKSIKWIAYMDQYRVTALDVIKP